ncbi:hypothetical protein ABE143_06840 [Bacillus subtilis]|uniref:hypothetical protein n=1 Tax=Bacillus TaxID=1386 RepID=UPI000E2FDC2F|nr:MULTISPECIES: hypothetical protein [Bacillus]QAR91655.1 hypothetical protein EQI87_03650 [Bacillus subtilis]QHH19063.1 hypothetical protein GTW28_03605 [Bacillus subtilis]RFB02757.1 hypothetical protein DZB72_15280 [Bacillus sp. MT]WFP00183.1 hypothetical protein JEQ25_03600 [Bacillus subtilis]
MIETETRRESPFAYIEGVEISETETGFSLTGCTLKHPEFKEQIFQMEPVEFDVVVHDSRNVFYSLNIVYVKETKTVEYKLFRFIADSDGYHPTYIDSTEYMLMYSVFDCTITPSGEITGTFHVYPKGEYPTQSE